MTAVTLPEIATVPLPEKFTVDVPDITTVDVAVNLTLAGVAPVNISVPDEL
jgi:hypothetical protein